VGLARSSVFAPQRAAARTQPRSAGRLTYWAVSLAGATASPGKAEQVSTERHQ